jgi:hypothetical protein
VEFDRNSNFVSEDILSNFVARSKNYGNCNSCQMNFRREEIIDKLME